MPITPAGFFTVSHSLKHDSQQRSAAITYGVDVGLFASEGPAQVLKQVFDGNWRTSFDSNVALGEVTLHGGTVNDPIQDVSTGPPVHGTGVSSSSTPANCALVIRKVTSRGGRRGRGRMFFPWVLFDQDVDDVGLIAAPSLSTLQNIANQWFIDIAEAGISMVVLHSPSGPDVQRPTTPGDPNPVTGLVCEGLIGSQRRRLGR